MFGRFSAAYAGTKRLGRIKQGATALWTANMPVTPTLLAPAPYLKIVQAEPFFYDLGVHFAGWHSIILAPGSPALPAGMTLSATGVLSGTATAAGMNQMPVIRAVNATSGLSRDHALLLSVAQRPGAMAKPVLTELTSSSFRVTRPATPANVPAITACDLLYGPALPLSEATGTVVLDAVSDATTTFDVTGLQAGSVRHVTLRAKAPWGDNTFLVASGWSPNSEPITLSGATSAPAFSDQPSISPATGPVGTVFTLNPGTASGNPAPAVTLVGLTQNGVNVLSQVVAGQFTSTEAGPLVASWQATNGIATTTAAPANASVTAVAQVPGQMSAPAATVVSASRIDVTVAAAPSNGGASITSYEVGVSLDQLNWTVIAGLAQGEAVSVLNLLASTAYYFRNAARNSVGLGPWSPPIQRISLAASGAGLRFGQFTAVGAGGIAVAEADGTYGQFTVTAGIAKPNTSPLTVGTAAIGATTVTIAAGEYSVASLAEFAAAKTHMTSAGGRTISFRPGSYDAPADYMLANQTYASRVVITAEVGAFFTGNFRLAAQNVTLIGLDLQCLDMTRAAVVWLSGPCTGCIITRNRIHGVHHDPLGDYSVNALNNPRGIYNTSPWLNGCEITRNEIFDVAEGVVLQLEGAAASTVTDNEVYWHFSDAFKFTWRPGSFASVKVIDRNYCHDGIGDPGDPNNPHIDNIQFVAIAENHQQPLTNVSIRSNVFTFTTKTRVWGDQGIAGFQDGAYRVLLKDAVIAGNVLQAQNYSLAWLMDGGVIAHNTIVTAPSASRSSAISAGAATKYNSGNTKPIINVIAGGAAPLLIRNVWEDAATTTGCIETDNLVIGDRGATIPYTTVFAGPGDMEADTLAQVAAEFAAKAGGPAAAGFGRGAIGSGIVTIGAPRDPSGWSYNPVFEQANPGVVQPLSVDLMPFDGYVFDAGQSQTVAAVRISGKGTSGQTIQVRGASAGGNTAWVSTTVDMVGNWVATVTVPVAQWGNWYSTEARIGTDDLTKVTEVTRLWGCGHVVGILGQSQNEHVMSVHSTYSSGYTFPALAAENFAMMTQSLAVAGNTLQTRRYTAASAVLGQINVAMAALANTLHLGLPGRKWLIVDLSEAGTSRAHLFWDGETTRRWTDLAAMVDLVRAGGSDIGAIIEAWQGDDAAAARTWCLEWSPFYIGQRWGGGAFAVGTVNPDSVWNNSKTVDHILWDCEAPSDQYGRGIFTRDRTKLLFAEFPPSNNSSTTTDQQNFTSVGGPTLRYDRPARDQLRLFSADPRTPCPAGLQGWAIHIADFSADVHPARNGAIWGVPQFGEQFTAPMLAWGGYNISVPKIIGTETAADGSYADVIVDLPANATLTTTRVLRALADPASPGPHYQPGGPIGFEIRRLGDSDGQRQAVWATSQTGKSAAYRATVMFADTGSGVWPNRRGRVRITPTQPFVAGDMIEYGRGEAMGVLVEPRDTDAQDWLDLLIAHVPALYDAAAEHRYHGAGVQPQPPLLTLSTNAGSTAPAAFVVGNWTLDDLAADGRLLVTIDALPANGGSPITDLQYRIDAGAWASFGAATIGAYVIAGLANGVSVGITIRAINSVGPAAASDSKPKAPTGDITEPTLTSPTDAANGATAATGSVSTNEANGSLFAVATTSATAPSAAQVEAGLDHLGAAAASVLSKAVTAIGSQTVSLTGLLASTAYWLHYMHKDAAGNSSVVVSGDGLTTAAGASDAVQVQSAVILSEFSSLGKTGFGPSTSFTVGSGPNRGLVLQFFGVTGVASVASTDAPTLTVTFNGRPVNVSVYRYHTTDRAFMAYGYLPNPPAGAGTLSVTASNNLFALNVVAREFNNAQQTASLSALNGNSGTSASITNNGTTTQPGSALISGLAITRRTAFPSADISVSSGTDLLAGHSPGATDLKTGYFACAYKAEPDARADSISYTLPESGPRSCWQSVELLRA